MPEPLTGELLALRNRLRDDTPFWAGGLSGGRPTAFKGACVIIDERKQKVRLVARPWQARTPDTPAHVTPLDEALEKQRQAGLPMRARILKARKLGFSTWVQAKFVQRVTQLPNRYALSIAHKEDSYAALARMARTMYDNLPNDHELGKLIYGPDSSSAAPFSIRPDLVGEGNSRGNRRMELGSRLAPSDASTYTTMTAGSKGGGRATTPDMLHLSEIAHYEDEEFLTGVLAAVPSLEDTIIIEESTANGFNHFYDAWQLAVDGQADPNTGCVYTPLFYGWQDNPAYATPFLSEDARESFIRTIGDIDGGGDEEEVLLYEDFGVSAEQLMWRRQQISTFRGSIDRFHQEHPATPEQAFIGSGQPVFPGILVAKMIRSAERAPEPVTGVLRGADWKERRTRAGSVLVPQRVIWVPDGMLSSARPESNANVPSDVEVWGDTRLQVWEHPVTREAQLEAKIPEEELVPDGQYVAFADISTGEGNTLTPGDFHCVQVLDHVSRMQVATWHSRVPLSDVPLILVLLGLYFNEAILAPEVTGQGQGVVDELKKFRYRRLYRRRRAGDDQRTDQREHLLGWYTDTRTKPLMEITFGTILKEEVHGLRCVRTGREFTTYVEDAKNPAKHGAQKGAHDDRVMSFMGAHRVAAEMRPRSPEELRERSVRGRRVYDDPRN